MNKLIVISGCSGGGKSVLLSQLSNNGYSVVPEVGREIVKEQIKLNSGITPWQNPVRFAEILVEKSVLAYHQAKKMDNAKDKIIYFDRSFLEGVSYYQALKIKGSNKYDHLIQELRYYSIILIVPPWEEIYHQDDERKHSFDEAVIEYERLLLAYPRFGYRTLEVPKMTITERFQFVVSMEYAR